MSIGIGDSQGIEPRSEQFNPELRVELFGEGPTPHSVAKVVEDGYHLLLGQVMIYDQEFSDLYDANGRVQGTERVWLARVSSGLHPVRQLFERPHISADAVVGPAINDQGSIMPGVIALWFARKK